MYEITLIVDIDGRKTEMDVRHEASGTFSTNDQVGRAFDELAEMTRNAFDEHRAMSSQPRVVGIDTPPQAWPHTAAEWSELAVYDRVKWLAQWVENHPATKLAAELFTEPIGDIGTIKIVPGSLHVLNMAQTAALEAVRRHDVEWDSRADRYVDTRDESRIDPNSPYGEDLAYLYTHGFIVRHDDGCVTLRGEHFALEPFPALMLNDHIEIPGNIGLRSLKAVEGGLVGWDPDHRGEGGFTLTTDRSHIEADTVDGQALAALHRHGYIKIGPLGDDITEHVDVEITDSGFEIREKHAPMIGTRK